jgi:hypothetical protein
VKRLPEDVAGNAFANEMAGAVALTLREFWRDHNNTVNQWVPPLPHQRVARPGVPLKGLVSEGSLTGRLSLWRGSWMVASVSL